MIWFRSDAASASCKQAATIEPPSQDKVFSDQRAVQRRAAP